VAEIPDILMFMRRVGPYHEEQMASIARHTKQSYTLVLGWNPEVTSFVAMNLAFARRTSRFTVLLDDDVILMDDGWLQHLVDVLLQHDDVAIVVPSEIKQPGEYNSYLEERKTSSMQPTPLLEMTWMPGYTMAIDWEKVPDLRCDEEIPGRYRMNDVDLCLQVRSMGYKVVLDRTFAVYHLEKIDSLDWKRKNDLMLPEEEIPLHRQQVRYMAQKWGNFYSRSLQARVISQIQ